MKMIKPAKLAARLRKVHRREQGLNLTLGKMRKEAKKIFMLPKTVLRKRRHREKACVLNGAVLCVRLPLHLRLYRRDRNRNSAMKCMIINHGV